MLEDSLNDQLSIEIVLNQYPQITPFYVCNSQEFQYQMAKHSYNLIITDINLEESVTGIDLCIYQIYYQKWSNRKKLKR